ncbi:PREDICTED: protocadherin alpha-3-like [Propithecus coquereli]|uniref:protocadherin alpha-3-like n=1 Tax=Propithecus coquereli TaxID=379532 RepID=UPI00063F2587|nr:PREDICTED: protocadherin alpha-3-like [Propithecus coquereli]
MLFSWREDPGAQRLLLSLLLLAAWEAGSGQLHYSVPEEAKHGTFVGRIAQDLGLELAELVPRLFRVASKDRGDLLEVNLQNGILFVNSRIDREELCGRSADCSIHLEVIVDRPLQVFHVVVEVKDINDNPPVFPTAVKNLFISESRQPGSRFSLEGASDADIGTNSLLTYNLDSTEYFTLDVKRNDEEIKSLGLVLKKLLNREDTPKHHLLITAIDGGKPELTGTTQVKITVLDVNDNAPEFERTVYKVRLFENVPNGTLVVIVNASDLDEGVNKDIVYSFNTDTSVYVLSKFHLDPVNGYISVKGNIDFEETKSYEIQVEATDKGNPPMADHCTVLVEILDVNDNVPELVIKSLSLPVLEDSPLGTVIALISVSDRDSGVNGQVTCNLTTHVPFKLVSTFKNYYSLVLDSPLDRESVSAYELVVTARDGGSPSLWATASVSVEVADVNDNAPAFPQPEYTVFNLFIAESRPLDSRFPLEGASDADIGENALLTYRLSPNEYFSLEKPSDDERVKGLGLILRKSLDREETPEIFLVLTVTDGGKPELTGTVQLLITVLDANDNAPVFDRTLYKVKLPENVTNGTLVIKLNASDLDEGLNGDIIYSFSSDTSPNVKSKFHIDPVTGQIMVKGYIDFEESKSYEIIVEGIDKGQLPLSGHCRVIVEVEDNNDNVPDLEFKSLSLPIREDAPVGTVIALISVSDRDSGANGQVTCTLTSHVPFKLVSTFKNYYSLVLDSALDRESVSAYELVVTARDGGSPSLWATASVSVEVADVNDNAPAFAQ